MRGCIFDLDGTLGDTRASLARSVGITLEKMGLPRVSKEECIRFTGNGARYLLEQCLEASQPGSSSRIEEALGIYREVFDENCTYEAKPYEGIAEALSAMKGQGIQLCVLSNKPHRQVVKVIHAMFGEDLFTYIQGEIEEIPRKPDPAGVYLALEKMHVQPEDCLYVGDSEVDAQTGRNAGLPVICVSWGFRTKEELKAEEPEYIIDKAEELLNFV